MIQSPYISHDTKAISNPVFIVEPNPFPITVFFKVLSNMF